MELQAAAYEKHLPSAVLDHLSLTSPRDNAAMSLREGALVACAVGACILAFLGPGLVLFGRGASMRKARAAVARRASGRGLANAGSPVAEA
jgi:hypothetical protein